APLCYSWRIDTTPPTAALTQQPPSLTNKGSATFAFTGSDDVTAANQLSFQVSRDGSAFAAATSPVSYANMGAGSHTFQAEAIDQASNVSAIVSYLWIIDTTPPTSSVNPLPSFSGPSFVVGWSGSDGANGSGIASFTILVSDNGASSTAWLTGTTQTSATYK